MASPLTASFGLLGKKPSGMAMPSKAYGYDIRQPYPGEMSFFAKNKGVAGMAADDNKITLNPFSGLKTAEQMAVARNEATRLWMRKNKPKLQFKVTPEQREFFKGTAYEKNPEAMKHTIVARIISGDPSAKNATPEQIKSAETIAKSIDPDRGKSTGDKIMKAIGGSK